MAKKVYIAEFDAKSGPYMRKLNDAQSKTLSASKKMEGAFIKVGAAIVAAFSIQQVISFGKELVELGAKVQGVRAAFTRLKDSQKLLEQLREATKGTVNDLILMQTAVKADKFRIPLELLAKGLTFAKQTAQDTGESIDYMVESFITGVARKSLPILDNLGIASVAVSGRNCSR